MKQPNQCFLRHVYFGLFVLLCLIQQTFEIATIPDNQILINNGAIDGGHFGGSIASGDFNGDGYVDILIGAPEENANEGAAYLIFGHPNSLSTFTVNDTMTEARGLKFVGPSVDSYFGQSVAFGDFNNDG